MAVSGVTPRTTRSGQNPSASSNNGAIVIENPSQGVNYSRAKNSPTKGRTSTTAAAQDSKSQLSAAKNSLNDLVAEEKLVLGKIKTLLAVIKQLKEYNPSGGNNLIIAQKQKELTAQYTRLSEIKNLKAAVAKRIKEFTSSVAEAETRVAAAVAAQQPTALKEDKSAKMNLSACKELYFRGTEQFMAETKDVSANAPGRAGAPDYLHNTSYKNAELLWGVGIATKGRIQTFVPPSTAGTDSKATKPKDSSSGATNIALGRRMFQFHYNPGSVNMTYGSVAVDLGLIASGGGLANVYSALGQVQFEILVNRMPDMKYIQPNGNYRKDGVNYLEVYDRTPVQRGEVHELKEIYNKGTMYDIEFLLKILMGGVSFRSWLRGNELTSDLGFAIPQPVELHLGNRLRYVISVTNLSLKHVIFNERMVPLFTTVSITANRIPADAIGTTNTDLTAGGVEINSVVQGGNQ